jgi:hypothetical protein
MGKTYLWDDKGSWVERGPIALGHANYEFYLLDAAGANVNGKTLRPIQYTSYRTELVNNDVYAVRKSAGLAEANRAKVQDPDAVIVVGMDQWVLTDTSKKAAVCTSGIIGCIGLAFIGGNKACATHILDGFEEESVWPEYQHQLDLPLTIMGRVDRAIIVASSSIYVYKCALIANYLEGKGISKAQQSQEISGGFALRIIGDNSWQFFNQDSPLQLFPKKEIVLTSKSARFCTNWGKLSSRASDSRGD